METISSGARVRLVPVDFSTDYMAGSDGHVYSRLRCTGHGKKTIVAWYPMKEQKTKKGYYFVSVYFFGKKITKSIHKIICTAFHGHPDNEILQVRHLDGNRVNNKPENLRWGTQEENWLDRKIHGRGNGGQSNPCAKLTDEECHHLRWAVEKGLCSQNHAAKVLGFSISGISHAIHERKEERCGSQSQQA